MTFARGRWRIRRTYGARADVHDILVDHRRLGHEGDAGDLAEQAAPIESVRARLHRHREDRQPMRNGREQCGVEPLRPDPLPPPCGWSKMSRR